MNDAPTRWMKVPEACAYAGVGRRLLYAEIAAGRLRAAKIGGRGSIRTCPEWLDLWLTAAATPVEIGRRRGRYVA